MSRGTSRSMRWFLEFDTTTCPARANACSISVATDESMDENSSRGALFGLHSSTMRSAAESGIVPARCHLVASRYFFPAERSLAPSHRTSNQGWPCRNLMKCWPTMPVAPKMPTSILGSITVSPCVDRFRLLPGFAASARVLPVCAPREWYPAPAGTADPMRPQMPEYRLCT